MADIVNRVVAAAIGRSSIDVISDCIPVIGTTDFTDLFLDVVRFTGAGQVTIFSYEKDNVNCLLSRNFLSEDRGGILAAAYIEGWFRNDPLFTRAMAMKDKECAVVRLENILPRISSQYLTLFFGAAGFHTKMSVLVADGPTRMALNLYFEKERARTPDDLPPLPEEALFRLLGKTVATHFSRLKSPEFPLPLAVLSERERQVCIGMLAGKKAEIIADEIGVGPSSVVTYRQRAYQKLGISSRGELFAICSSGSALQSQF